ncbi:MAG: hypothetical protein SFU91_04775 [Chloroherpetonaceae bacterium]|nr:hypothetical protein [Chloroherpetonaceae bacterium]
MNKANQNDQAGETFNQNPTASPKPIRRKFSGFRLNNNDISASIILGTERTPQAMWYQARPAVFYALTFAIICSVAAFALSGKAISIQFGSVFGIIFGSLYFSIQRVLIRNYGESIFSLLIHGFSGGVSGVIASVFTKLIHPYGIYKDVIDAIYGTGVGVNSEPERAFFIIMGGAFFGGFLGVTQSLLAVARLSAMQTEEESNDGNKAASNEESEAEKLEERINHSRDQHPKRQSPPNRVYAPRGIGRNGMFGGFSHN